MLCVQQMARLVATDAAASGIDHDPKRINIDDRGKGQDALGRIDEASVRGDSLTESGCRGETARDSFVPMCSDLTSGEIKGRKQ